MRRALLALLVFSAAVIFLAVTRQARVLEQPSPRGAQPLLSTTEVPPLPTATATATRQATATPTATATERERTFARTGTAVRPSVTFVPRTGTPIRPQGTPGARQTTATPRALPTTASDPILAGMLAALRAATSVAFTETFTEQPAPNDRATPVPISENTVELVMGPPARFRFVSKVGSAQSEIILIGRTLYTGNGDGWEQRELTDAEAESTLRFYALGSVCGRFVLPDVWEQVPTLPRRTLENLNGEQTIVYGLDEIKLNVYEQFNLWVSLNDYLPRKVVQPNPSRVTCMYTAWNDVSVLPPP